MTPAAALANDLLSRGFRVEIITDTRGLKYKSMFGTMTMHVVPSGTLGKGIWGKIKGVFYLSVGMMKARKLIKKLNPALVVGFGGYPSVPGVYWAQRFNIPTIIHEQNAILGKANAYLAPRASRIALSWPNARGIDDADKSRSVITGNPIRPEIAALFTQAYPNITQDDPLRIFIMGGSLGAKVFSEVAPQALGALSPANRARLHIVQQCRADAIDAVRESYRLSGIKADLATFFDDVAGELAKAHLFIGRSGASTVAEIAVAGRPAIFVPYPHHKDHQQKINADAIANAGGAWVMTENEFTPEALLARLETFLQNPGILFKAAEKARECGKPDAARLLGNLATEMVSDWERKT